MKLSKDDSKGGFIIANNEDKVLAVFPDLADAGICLRFLSGVGMSSELSELAMSKLREHTVESEER